MRRLFFPFCLFAIYSCFTIFARPCHAIICDGTKDTGQVLADADQDSGAIVLSGGPCRVSHNITLHQSIQGQRGGMLAPDAGVTVTLSAQPVDGIAKIFSGAGKIQFSTPVTLRPEWWGAGSGAEPRDDSQGILAACHALAPNTQTPRKLLSGDTPRTGSILFRSVVYTLRHPITCSFGVKYYAENGPATLTLASGVNPRGVETFVFAIDPPADHGEALANEAFSTIVDNIAISAAGNSNVSGLLFYGAQGAYLNNVSSQYTDTRGIVIYESPIEANRGTLMAGVPYLTGIGPAIEMGGVTATFDVLNVSDTNRTGRWRSVDVSPSITSFSPMPSVSVALDPTGRVLVHNLSDERQFHRPVYLNRVPESPRPGEFSLTAGGSIQFSSQDHSSKRILFRAMQLPVTAAARALVPPVPGLQVDNGGSIQARAVFAEGNFAAIRLIGTHGVGIDYLEAHPSEGAVIGHGEAAVLIAPGTTETRFNELKIFNPPASKAAAITGYDFAIWEEETGMKTTVKPDPVNPSFSYGSYHK